MNKPNMTGKDLRRYRDSLGLSQRRFAPLFGVTFRTLQRLEGTLEAPAGRLERKHALQLRGLICEAKHVLPLRERIAASGTYKNKKLDTQNA